MFEFEDSKLGKLKVVNVTEARANIATIMHDKDSNYVITKNNKPIRVIINYNQYKNILDQLPDVIVPATSGKTTKVVTEVKSSIKGFLQTRETDLKKQEQVHTKKSYQSPKPSLSKTIEKVLTHSVAPPVEKKEEITPAEQTIPAITEKVITKPIEHPVETQIIETEQPLSVTTVTQPPSDDYFDRFKKLYSAPQFNEIKNEPAPNTFEPSSASKETFTASKTASPFPMLEESLKQNFDRWDDTSVKTQSSKSDARPQFKDIDFNQSQTQNKIEEQPKALSDDHLPSIQDLLKTLKVNPLDEDEDNDYFSSPLSGKK